MAMLGEKLYFGNNKALVLITTSIVNSKVVDYDISEGPGYNI